MNHPIVTDKDRSIIWARRLLKREFVILDSETTGLKLDAEACQIAVLSCAGEVLVDTLIKPSKPIPAEATAIHGIDNEMVESAPKFRAVISELENWLAGRVCVVYNVGYDRGILAYMLFLADVHPNTIGNWVGCVKWQDAMLPYAAFVGEIGRYGDYKWQKLPNDSPDAHSAISDCRATLRLIQMMAATPLSTEAA